MLFCGKPNAETTKVVKSHSARKNFIYKVRQNGQSGIAWKLQINTQTATFRKADRQKIPIKKTVILRLSKNKFLQSFFFFKSAELSCKFGEIESNGLFML